MGVRINRKMNDVVRDRIQTQKLVTFLEDHVFTGKEVKKTQVSAAVALLRKVLPDLQSIEGQMDLTHIKHEEALRHMETAAEEAESGGETDGKPE